MSPLQRPAQYGYRAGSPRPYAGGRTLRGRLSSLPGARRNGRASASLTARGGGLPIGVTFPKPKYPDTSFTPLWQRGAGGISGHAGQANPPYPPFTKGGNEQAKKFLSRYLELLE